MKGEAVNLVELFEGKRKSFVIPVYQRRYSWTEPNCRQLFKDLIKVIREKKNSHFFGSIVSVSDKDGSWEHLQIVDGQQRLTTISLLLLAMYTLLQSGEVESTDPELKDEIYEECLTSKAGKLKLELSHAEDDFEVYRSLFPNTDPDKRKSERFKASNLKINFDFFCCMLREQTQQEQAFSIDDLYTAVRRLVVIWITLKEGEDDPQLIFESLNSTGLALTEGDKIRNFLLMNMPIEKQNDCYTKYWGKIEQCCDLNVSAFVRDYLSIKLKSIAKINTVFFVFRDYVEKIKSQVPVQDLLAELLCYAELWHILLKGGSGSRELDRSITRLNSLETTVVRPFLLRVLYLKENALLSPDDTLTIFKLTESLLLRRAVCDLYNNGLAKMFAALHSDIVNCSPDKEKFHENYTEKFKYVLMLKRGQSRFPTDEEFSRAFMEKDMYHMRRYFVKYIMERLENGDTREFKPVFYGQDVKEAPSIEHIMPQHLNEAWRRDLGENYAQIHERWVDRIANLTLTAYNSAYSNRPFADKKNSKNGFAESGYRLNKWVSEQERWTEAELEARSKLLAERALELWPYPATDYRSAAEQPEYYALNDDTVDFTNRKAYRVQYKDLDVSMKTLSYKQLLKEILRCLYHQDKSIILRLAQPDNEDTEFKRFLSSDKTALRDPLEIEEGEGVYFETNSSTEYKMQLLNRLFDRYGEDPSDVLIYLRPPAEKGRAGKDAADGGKSAEI